MKRKIAVITTSRADYGHLRWPLKRLHEREDVEVRLIVTAAHLSPEFGLAIREIEADGFPVDHRIEALLSSDTDVGMAKTIGVATLGLADVLGHMRPDLLLLIADRYEMLAPAAVALALRIPIAHIEGGDVSEGAIDDAVRNALTKMSHLHFTPTALARRRVLAMGEEPWRVHRSGAPSLDQLTHGGLLTDDALIERLGHAIAPETVLVAYHPVTLDLDPTREARELFAALEELEAPLAFCFPNADAGSHHLIERARDLTRGREGALYVNLPSVVYWSVLARVSCLLGNSSSGIMETPSLRIPTVNVGRRQQGRERARNVIDAPPEKDAILRAVSLATDPAFRESLLGMENPYGDGTASAKIAEVLATVPLDERLLLKRALPLAEDRDAFVG